MKFCFHVVGLPHTETTLDYSACAFTEKVRKFCKMMMGLGHEVFLYAAGEITDAPCTEFISCLSSEDLALLYSDMGHYTTASFNERLPHWQAFNATAIAAIKARAQPRDFICVIGGSAHKPIADAFPAMMTVEFGIGYGGTFAKYRVWESYAWMHACYAAEAGRAVDANPHWFDAVIPNSFEPEIFTYNANKDNYFLFVGRLIPRKGYQIAIEVCEYIGAPLRLAGPMSDDVKLPHWCEYYGVVGPGERSQLMSGARALFAPTLYIEPFGGVAVEAMACGTPVITTDWGAFTETVIQGVTGFRCRTQKEFVQAAKKAHHISSRACHANFSDNYSLAAVAPKYQAYFERLSTLWEKGWYE